VPPLRYNTLSNWEELYIEWERFCPKEIIQVENPIKSFP